jgi:hypothetical protein
MVAAPRHELAVRSDRERVRGRRWHTRVNFRAGGDARRALRPRRGARGRAGPRHCTPRRRDRRRASRTTMYPLPTLTWSSAGRPSTTPGVGIEPRRGNARGPLVAQAPGVQRRPSPSMAAEEELARRRPCAPNRRREELRHRERDGVEPPAVAGAILAPDREAMARVRWRGSRRIPGDREGPAASRGAPRWWRPSPSCSSWARCPAVAAAAPPQPITRPVDSKASEWSRPQLIELKT